MLQWFQEHALIFHRMILLVPSLDAVDLLVSSHDAEAQHAHENG